MIIANILTQGFSVMLLGLAGVFLTLIIFYAIVRVMLIIARRVKKKAL